MSERSRREFLRAGGLGLAMAPVLSLWLPDGAVATEPSGGVGSYGQYRNAPNPASKMKSEGWAATEDNILGPFHRPGAPYRAKITPPLEPGRLLLVSGRVWGLDTKKPLAGAMLEIWQANARGRYDNDDPAKPPAAGVFMNRARLVTDEQGYYEYETIHPGRYQIGEGIWRPAHIHYWVHAKGYQELVTQLYFKGDPHNAADQFIKPSLIMDVAEVKQGNASYERGVFNIVLAPAG